jgi:hypothetical protein
MPSFWDLRPASLWPTQPFIPPGNPRQDAAWSPRTGVPWESAASSPDHLVPDAPASSWPWDDDRYRQMLADAKRASEFARWVFGPPSATSRLSTAPSLRAAGMSGTLPSAPSSIPPIGPTQTSASSQVTPSPGFYGTTDADVATAQTARGAAGDWQAGQSPGGWRESTKIVVPGRFFDGGARAGSKTVSDGPSELNHTGALSPLPTPQYGVIPKTSLAQFGVPPALSDWQRPESEFDIDAPRMAGRVKKALADGVNRNEIILNDPGGRERRDAARVADFFFPGAGNFVSGDWTNITGDDVARLALGAASAAGPLSLGNAARTGTAAARVAMEGEGEAAGAMARSAYPGVNVSNMPSVRQAPASLLDGANFAQKDYSPWFDRKGKFAGWTVDGVADALRSGTLKPADVAVNYVNRDGNRLIVNTRSATALEKAGIPRSQWNAIDSTGDSEWERRLDNQLRKNDLSS